MTEPTKVAKVPVSVGVDPAIIRRLDAAAKRDERPRADIMRRAFTEFLDREGITDPQAPDSERGPDAGPEAQRKRRPHR